MMEAIDQGHNQYTRTFGQIDFCKKIAEVYGKQLKRQICGLTEVLVTLGANGSINCFITAFLNKDDEIVTFEPMYQPYLDHIELSGGKVIAVPLEGDQWTFDPQKLRQALQSLKVKLFLLTNPHNPTGRVFQLDEL